MCQLAELKEVVTLNYLVLYFRGGDGIWTVGQVAKEVGLVELVKMVQVV